MIKKLCLTTIILTCLISLSGYAQQPDKQHFAFTFSDVKKVKTALRNDNFQFDAALQKLQHQADQAHEQGPFSVVFDDQRPPSGDKHDYMSMGKYWWPDPDNPDGPYIRRDGVTHPEADRGDKVQRRGMYRAVETLGLAYYFFEQEQYAQHAADLLRTWFIDPETRMNPHLRYGQYIPGRNTGRQYGIIETRPFVRVLDAVQFLRQSAAWTEDNQTAIEQWFSHYLDWLLTSDFGKKEGSNGNNHETAYYYQVASFALFVNKSNVASDVFNNQFKRIVAEQIEPDGRQPREIERTKGLHYSSMNLSLMFHICGLAASQGMDLYHYQTPDGRSVEKSFEFLLPFFKNPEAWPYQQIEKSDPDYDELFHILRRTSEHFAQNDFESILRARYADEYYSHRGQLYWPYFEDKK